MSILGKTDPFNVLMARKSVEVHEAQAIELAKQGFSGREIAKRLNLMKDRADAIVRGVNLTAAFDLQPQALPTEPLHFEPFVKDIDGEIIDFKPLDEERLVTDVIIMTDSRGHCATHTAHESGCLQCKMAEYKRVQFHKA